MGVMVALIAPVLLILAAAVVFRHAETLAPAIAKSWRPQPLMRLFPATQFELRPVYVRVFALVIAGIGVLDLYIKIMGWGIKP